MKISLTTKIGQQLSLTPQLQQAIRLLALSNLELRQELERFSLDNPLLEIDEPRSDVDGDGEVVRESSEASEESSSSDSAESEANSGDGPDDYNTETDSLADWKSSGAGGDDNDFEPGEASPESLADHLREQAAGLHLSKRDRAWLEILIEALDEDGYLRDDPLELADGFAEMFEAHFDGPLEPEELSVGLRLLKSLDPIGVGAQSLEECLRLQLEELLAQHDPEDPARATVELAIELVQDHLPELGSQAIASLAKSCGRPKDLVAAALALVRGLEPKPATAYQTQAAAYLIPDVIVQRDRRGRWSARLSRGALPRLSINADYARLIRDGAGDTGLQQKLQEARWMLKNIQQRSDTILRVSQAIVSAQQRFFEEGAKAMKPMVLRDIADACELHESTVSRVTTQKFMPTPLGCFELKYFFSSHVGTDDGGAASATALRAQIQEWIAAEPSDKPLSDQSIADRFAEQGVVVARRTVAKYREGLRIPSASLRKRG